MKLTFVRRRLPGTLATFAAVALLGALGACEPTATEQTGLSSDEAEGPPTSTTQRPGVDEDWNPHGGGPPASDRDDDVNPPRVSPPADWQQQQAIERPGDQGPPPQQQQQQRQQQGAEQPQGLEQQPDAGRMQGIEEPGGSPGVTPDADTEPREDGANEFGLPQRPHRPVEGIDDSP